MNTTKTYTVDEATKILEKYCAYQERCHKEVEKRLYDLNMIPEAREKIILHLLGNNYLNEERFSRAYARGKFTIKKWGRIRITNELKFRGISAYNIKAALSEIDEETYQKNFHELAVKKIAATTESNVYKKKQKVVRFLLSKGYESNLTYEIVNKLL